MITTTASIAKNPVFQMQFEQAYSYLMPKLEKELPGYITYHTASHTKDVIRDAKHLCEKEGVSEEEEHLVLTAALFHDAGFLKGYANHEMLGCQVARVLLPKWDYTPTQIETICKIIMATKLPQRPTNLLEQIICDADLYYLGRDHYAERAEKLYQEFTEVGVIKEDQDWHKVQIDFLKSHRFFTGTALTENENKKRENLHEVHIKAELEKKKIRHKHQFVVLQDVFYMALGILFVGFALKSFLVPNHFFDGGVTGISLLIHELYNYNLAFVIVLANLPLLALGYFTVGKRFAYKSFLCVVILGFCLMFFPYPELHVKEYEKILIAIFGGFFLGTGIGLSMRSGTALDGVEVLALNAFKKLPFTVSEIILAINICIFSIAAIQLGVMTALYSIVTYFTATKTIDYVVEGIEEYSGVTIISGESELIKYRLVNELGKGITVYKGERGFLPGKFEISKECDIIFTVVTRLELRKLKQMVHETDPKSFVFASTIKEASGGILSRRAAH